MTATKIASFLPVKPAFFPDRRIDDWALFDMLFLRFIGLTEPTDSADIYNTLTKKLDHPKKQGEGGGGLSWGTIFGWGACC